jgi:hypothetical protein
MLTKAQCKIHRDVTLDVYASRIQMSREKANELMFVVKPCHMCLSEAREQTVYFAMQDLQNTVISKLRELEDENG